MSVSVTQREASGQDELRVWEVLSASDRRRFVELPYQLYHQSSCWVPPLRRDECRRLSPRHNPFFDHASMRLWLARRSGRLVGRIAAIDDRLHNETHCERVTWFGFFEAADAAAARALFGAVEEHAVSVGHVTLRGPANPSLHDAAGLLVDAFDEVPFLMTAYNPPEYAGYVEAAGYRKVKDLLAWDLDLTAPIGARIRRLYQRLASRGRLRIRTVETSTAGFARDLEHLKTIYRAAWSDNWGFVPPTDAEIEQLAIDLKPVVDPEMALFVEIDGEVVGCALALPDFNQVLTRMRGRLLPFGFVHYLRRRRLITRTRALLLGVLPRFRRLGLYPLLIGEWHRRGVARGYTRAELSWTLEDNHAVNEGIRACGGRHSKTFRLYEKPVG